MTLWGAKSGQNSCLSSRSNSALTLTDTEMDNKSDNETECLTRASTKASAYAHKSGASANVDPFLIRGERRPRFLKMKPDGSSYQSAALDDPLSAAAEME
ncbi:unnamed protein product [Tetraodon nigroviridis]|uniref:(spotted green pufferfish) hypothetical protein n=1 Tax=Tetraodon nigroviridis TaxID=99883 RepID=Q4S400_TETNG|nr:unnamed protein product [Tetraodon nigroviridis]